jgi:adenine deaminase
MEKDSSVHACMQVALGKKQADLVITKAQVINVYTGEILPDQTICTHGKWIASVGPCPGEKTIGPDTQVIDASGKTVIPGLIDAHTHILGQYFDLLDFLKIVIPSGTTTLITEMLEPVFISGQDGFFDVIRVLRDQPLSIFFLVPPLLSISPNVTPLSGEAVLEMLQLEDVLGMGESYWQLVLSHPDLILPRMQETLRQRKFLEGHSAGARGQKLNAYVCTGISSCHEPISVEEVIERLRLGLHVMIREGSIRSDLEVLASIQDYKDIDLRRLLLVTDSVTPHDLLQKGAMEYVVQKAIDVGFDPVTALRMATLNPAEHFGLDALIGGIAPGKQADMVIIPDPETIRAEYVISQGAVVAQQGLVLKSPRQDQLAETFRKTVNVPADRFQSSDFSIAVPNNADTVQVLCIDQITDLVTREKVMALPGRDGFLQTDIEKDLLKIAAIDRVHNPGQTFVGFIHGIGLKYGAFASSAAWDTTDIIVVGADEEDMAIAVNRIHELQGGLVVCSKKKITSELPLPIFGLLPDLETQEVIRHLDHIREQLWQMGVHFDQPWLTLNVLTTAAIPFVRICEQGLVNFKEQIAKGCLI